VASNPNTQTLKQVWQDVYETTHYKQPVFRAIAEEKMLTSKLKKGDTIHWSYMSDMYVENMGGNGSYNTQAQTDTDETLVITYVKDSAFYEFEKDLEQAHYPVKKAYAEKAMNKIFLQIDADVLTQAYLGASSVIDNGNVTGGTSSGVPVVPSSGNIAALFSVCLMQFQLNNVVYDPNLTFTGEVKLEKVTGMPVAIISPQVYQALVLYLGGKTTVLGDKVSVSGHAGAFMSFNIFVSNQVTSSIALSLSTLPTSGDTFTINGLTFTFVTGSLGTTAGNILVATNAANAQTALIAALAAPFTQTTTYYPQTNNVTNQIKLANLTCSAFASNLATIYQGGIGVLQVTIGQNTGANVWGGSILSGAQIGGVTSGTVTVIQHNIFAVSRSVGLCLQGSPSLYVNPVSGQVGHDYVTWCYYGIKVFKYMTTQLLDVQVNATSYAQPLLTTN
jgi:hypothetical protein